MPIAMDVKGSMLSIPVRVPECPDSFLTLLFMCQKLDQKLARSEWHCYPVLVNNSWRIYQVLHKPITGVDNFDVFGIEECSSADWNAQSGVNLPITLMECNRMSQHCPFMILNSKQ